MRTLLSCGADPAVKNAHGRNAVDVAASEVIRLIYVEELLRATAASEYVFKFIKYHRSKKLLFNFFFLFL